MAQRINNELPPAMVVGLCSHGLAVVKALALNNIKVYAIESDTSLPGTKTKYAEVHIVKGLNNINLIDSLIEIRARIKSIVNPVLFLMNDKMVRLIGEHWDKLENYYQLSWADSRSQVLELLSKSNVVGRCKDQDLNHPISKTINSENDARSLAQSLDFPVIVKPVSPLGKFKVLKVDSQDALDSSLKKFTDIYPVLAQEWISGNDRDIYFCGLYLSNNKMIARFDGRKIKSFPEALGQTLIAEPFRDDSVYQVTQKFFENLNITGCVSLEIKKDNNQNVWIIEPTVGRTDFWVKLCTENGINFPFIEYSHVVGSDIKNCTQTYKTRWFDTEKSPLCFIKFTFSKVFHIQNWLNACFPYLSTSDFKPFFKSVYIMLQKYKSG